MKKSEFGMIEMSGFTDAELVAGSIAGDREAFAQIVERYQRLLCSLAYAATGRLAESEDLAQEAFVTAWKGLGKLREPEKLKPWLCGILRNTVSHSRRRKHRDPIHKAGELEDLEGFGEIDNPVSDGAMKAEEEQILWRTLQAVPERYREPLILYYREERSVAAVAEALDLTESAVKQRLVRGRKLLRERLLGFVEGALERSTPGPVFTAGVIAAIATLAPSAKAAAVGGSGLAAAKVGMTVKTAGIAGFLAALSGPISTVLSVRVGLDQARTKRERRAIVWTAALLFGSFVPLVLGMLGLRLAAVHWPSHAVWLAVLSQITVVAFAIGWPVLLTILLRRSRELRHSERETFPDAFKDPRDQKGSAAGEFRTRRTFLGIPLVHFRFATAELGDPPVIAWIAGGDRAVGILFAWGAWSCGLISVGAVSIGVFSLGAVSVGLLSLGSIAIGIFALGAMAIGWLALASMSALGWQAAQGGGFSIARQFAEGPVAFAAHANDAVARAWFATPHADLYLLAFFGVTTFLTLVPVGLYARAVRNRLGKKRPS
jgi:RNA polymerase sigma factor (sigma-70 family)